MYFWIVNCSLAFLLCVLCAGIVIPQILLIAFRKKLFDFPDERKVHHCAVPRLGGIAFKPVVFFTIALLLGINMVLGHSEILSEIGNDVCSLAFAFCSIMVLYLVGMADDLIGIRYRAKFVIQILCGVMLIAGGVYINNLYGVLGIHAVPLWLGYPLTILIVVFRAMQYRLPILWTDFLYAPSVCLCHAGVCHIGSVGTILLLQCFRERQTRKEDLHGRHRQFDHRHDALFPQSQTDHVRTRR